jgi:hypothetical protein
MKRIKKTIYLETITLVIVGLMIFSTASAITQEPQVNENTVITQTNKINIKPTASTSSQPVENKVIYRQPSNTLGIPIFNSVITPTISNSGSAMVVGFNAPDDENVFFSGSTDNGATWTDGQGWVLDEPPELPDVDGCGDGRFIASMVPNWLDADGGTMYVVQISDSSDTDNGYTCGGYTWNDVGTGYTNFIDVAVGGYTAVDPAENEWAYGGFSIIGDYGTSDRQSPFFSYEYDENSAWIYGLADEPGQLDGGTSTSMDIDPDTLYSYAVYNYNNAGNKDIYLFMMDFGQWGTYEGSPSHENAWQVFLTTTGNDNNLDVSALNDNVIIVSERDGNIVAYYANDPVNNDFSEITITTGGKDPRISHYDEEKAVCEFIKNGDSYFSYTEDGGVTWSTPELASEEPDVQSGDVCAYGYAYESADTVYFAPTDFSQAILTIDSISGGFGVSAVVKNVGTAAAENVDWSIVTAGTVFLGGEKTGQVTLQPGASATIKTGLILGFDTIDVTVTLGTVTKEASGKLLLFYITGLA